jgi:site-specific recombinase XerD
LHPIFEISGVTSTSADLAAKRIRVKRSILDDGHETTPKNHRVRDIPISSELQAALKRHRHLKGDLVFCNNDGSVLTRFQMRSVVPRACRLAGLRRVQWHVLRHSFASQLVMAGKPLKPVQELLGHSTIQMTMRYAHLAESTLIDAVESLDSTTQGPAGFGHHVGTSEIRSL